MNRLYFDHNATSPLRPEIREVLTEFMTCAYGNPSAIHTTGRKLRSQIDDAREAVARVIGAKPSEIIFTSGGVEANHMAWTAFEKPNVKIATTVTEHSCVRGASQKSKALDAHVHEVCVHMDGSICDQEMQKLVDFEPDFFSMHHANNETGALYDVASFVQSLPEKTWIHTDAVQTVGKMPVHVDDLNVHYLSLSAHKLGGLQGAGALYVRKGAPFESIWPGGGQERGRRGGTENVIGILSLGKACELIAEQLDQECKHYKALRTQFEEGLQSALDGIHITAQDHPRIPNTSHVIFEGVDAESLMIAADLEGLDCSTGSACHSGSIDPSPVVLAMGFERERALGAIRFSFGWTTTAHDIEKALTILPKLVQRIRKK
jgi:cysteine desulfurase